LTASVTLGYDNGDGADGAPDGDFDDPEDEICNTISVAVDGGGSGTITAADFGGATDYAGAACYSDLGINCPCGAVAPGFVLGELCPDGVSYSTPPYTISATGAVEGLGDITE